MTSALELKQEPKTLDEAFALRPKKRYRDKHEMMYLILKTLATEEHVSLTRLKYETYSVGYTFDRNMKTLLAAGIIEMFEKKERKRRFREGKFVVVTRFILTDKGRRLLFLLQEVYENYLKGFSRSRIV